MKHRFVLIELTRLGIYFLSLHFMLLIKILCSCKKHSNAHLVSKLYLLTLFSFGVFKHLQSKRSLVPQYMPWREMFPVTWPSPGRPPRSEKGKKSHSTQKGEGMGSKITSASHQKPQEQAITSKLVGVEMDT